jgi:hypothetical protein
MLGQVGGEQIALQLTAKPFCPHPGVTPFCSPPSLSSVPSQPQPPLLQEPPVQPDLQVLPTKVHEEYEAVD